MLTSWDGHHRAAMLPDATREEAEAWMDDLLVGVDPARSRFEVDREFWDVLDLYEMAWRGVPIDVCELDRMRTIN